MLLLGLLGLTTSCAAVVLQAHAPSARLLAPSARPPLALRMSQSYETAGIGQSEKASGMHATGFRFMPISTMRRDEAALLFAIAGAYPGLTAEQLTAPQALPFPDPGKWNYHRLTSDAIPGGFITLPADESVLACPNTVAVVCSSSSLGLEAADGQEHEVVALINRSDKATTDPAEFDERTFYAMADESGAVQIRWIDALPAGWRILGRLIYTQMPFVVKPNETKGFAETSDDFEF